MERRSYGVSNSPGSLERPLLGAGCTSMPTAHCRGQATGSPTSTSSWPRRSWGMMPRSMSVPGRCRNWRAAGVTPRALTFPRWRAAFASFAREDFPGAIAALARLAGQNERIGGSRAQHDLIEFTLLRAYIEANRLQEAKRLLDVRRPGASGVPVMGIAAVH